MKKLLLGLALLIIAPLTAKAQFWSSVSQVDSFFVRGNATASADVEVTKWQNTKDIKTMTLWAKCDTTALDSIAFYVVLEGSAIKDTNWIPIDSTASITTINPTFKQITNLGAPNLRIRINALAGNSRNPVVPYSVKVVTDKK